MNLKTLVGGAQFNLVQKQKNRKPCPRHGDKSTAGCGSCDIPKDDERRAKKILDAWQVPGTESECICEVTAFGMVVNEKCTYLHKA